MLVIGVRLGQVVDIGPHWIATWSLNSKSDATIMTSAGRQVGITSRRLVEVFPSIFVGLGPRPTEKLRLLINAPRPVPIGRRACS
jgi:hypothetical protein